METGIYYKHNEAAHTIKLVGELRFDQSHALYDLLASFKQEKITDTLKVDLKEVTYLDSTMLGALSALGTYFLEHDHQPYLIGGQADILRIIHVMGLTQIFKPCEEKTGIAGFKKIEADFNKSDTEKRVIEAHKSLIDLNEHNQREFSDLVEQLKNKANSND